MSNVLADTIKQIDVAPILLIVLMAVSLVAAVVAGLLGPERGDVVRRVSLLATLSATSVQSACTFDTNTGTVSGTTTIADGEVSVTGLPAIVLDFNPPPNSAVSVPGIATITLNRQTVAADGTLTVTAISVSLLGTTQTLSIGTSVCNAANLAPVPMVPGTDALAAAALVPGVGATLIPGTAASSVSLQRLVQRRPDKAHLPPSRWCPARSWNWSLAMTRRTSQSALPVASTARSVGRRHGKCR